MTDDELHGLAGAYALDAVDAGERARFDSHLVHCAECRAELASLRSAAVALGGLAVASPPASLRAAVLSGIRSVRPLPPLAGGAAPVPVPVPGTAGAPAAPEATAPEPAVSDGPGVAASPPGQSRTDELSERRLRRQAGRGGLRRWGAGLAAAAVLGVVGLVWQPWETDRPLTRTEQVLQAADAQRFTGQLTGGGSATFVRSPALNQAVVVTEGLPELAAGNVYQLWLRTGDGSFASAGLLPPSAAGRVTATLSGEARTAQGAGITVEPAGGSLQPTSPPLVLLPFA